MKTVRELRQELFHQEQDVPLRLNVNGTTCELEVVKGGNGTVFLQPINPQAFSRLCPSEWCCPECEDKVMVDMTDVVDIGSPVCGNCDCDMELVASEVEEAVDG